MVSMPWTCGPSWRATHASSIQGRPTTGGHSRNKQMGRPSMAETSSDRALMALLALELDAADDQLSEVAQQTAPEAPRLPTLAQRIEMFLKAVYGPDVT